MKMLLFRTKSQQFLIDHSLALEVNEELNKLKDDIILFENMYNHLQEGDEVSLYGRQAYILKIKKGSLDVSENIWGYRYPEITVSWMNTRGHIIREDFRVYQMCQIKEAL